MKKLDIIYEDKDLLVVNKPSKLLTISDGITNNTLYHMAREYVKKKHKTNMIFIVHRLDKDTSGVVVFAKNEAVKKYLQDNWSMITKRWYLGILFGQIKGKKGIIKNYLAEDKTHKVYVVKNKRGEYAETYYEVLGCKKNCSIVKILIKTGKKNQIRVSFANLGFPIVGDKKYGNGYNPIGRLGLHAYKLELNFKGKYLNFEAKIPREFNFYLNSIGYIDK